MISFTDEESMPDNPHAACGKSVKKIWDIAKSAYINPEPQARSVSSKQETPDKFLLSTA